MANLKPGKFIELTFLGDDDPVQLLIFGVRKTQIIVPESNSCTGVGCISIEDMTMGGPTYVYTFNDFNKKLHRYIIIQLTDCKGNDIYTDNFYIKETSIMHELDKLYNRCKALVQKHPFTTIIAKAPPAPSELSFHWVNHYHTPVLCKIMPRKIFKDQPVKPEVEAHRGWIVNLICLWPQEADDKYPGEYALGSVTVPKDTIDEDTKLAFNNMGISWISSLDVVVLQSPNGTVTLDGEHNLYVPIKCGS